MGEFSEATSHAQSLWGAFATSRELKVRSQLIEHYMPIARMIAARAFALRPNQSASFDDYLQYARVGLIEAVDRFDCTRNVSFDAYSMHRIRGAILTGIARESETAAQHDFWRTRDPDRIHSLISEAPADPERLSFRDLTDITIGLALGLVLDENVVEPVDESPRANPYNATELEQFARLAKKLVGSLPEREREIITQHYFNHQEFQSIAARFGVTKGRISQLHAQALRRLRHLLAERPRLDRKF